MVMPIYTLHIENQCTCICSLHTVYNRMESLNGGLTEISRKISLCKWDFTFQID